MSTTNESCFGRADGTASVFATSPAGGFTYVWTQSPPGTQIDSNQTAMNLSGNVYDIDSDGDLDTNFYYIVTVTDAVGCVKVDTAYLLQPDSIEVIASVVNDVSCFGGADGSLTALVIGRNVDEVTYDWSDGSVGDTITGLSVTTNPTAFVVVVTDSFGCTASDTVDLSQPLNPIYAEFSGSTISCADSMDGVITIDTIGGGTPNSAGEPYSYSFNGAGPFGTSSCLYRVWMPEIIQFMSEMPMDVLILLRMFIFEILLIMK